MAIRRGVRSVSGKRHAFEAEVPEAAVVVGDVRFVVQFAIAGSWHDMVDRDAV